MTPARRLFQRLLARTAGHDRAVISEWWARSLSVIAGVRQGMTVQDQPGHCVHAQEVLDHT